MVKQRERVSHRTVCNLYISIACFLHFCGVDHKKLLPQSERPSPVDETPEAYTEEEMTKFIFVITKERDALAFEMMLKTGPREQELANLEWEHLDLGKTPTVSYKTRDNFRSNETFKVAIVSPAISPNIPPIPSHHSSPPRLLPDLVASS
jgi:integrase